MNKTFNFKYGKTSFNIDLTDKAEILNISEPEFCITRDQFEEDFSSSLPGGLSHCCSAGFAVSIVVADKTRLCDYKTYLPWMLDILHKNNIQKPQIKFFIAYGTHARQSDEECCAAYGDVYKHYRFIHHDCSDRRLFTWLGKTDRGTEIHVRKDILESDLIITFGALSHHYFAGYGGGRKLLFPGLGYKPDIYANHGLFLDRDMGRLASGCNPGNLKNNPIAEDLKQIDNAVKIKRIAVHGILDSKAEVCRLIVGSRYNDFINACGTLDVYYKNRYRDIDSSGARKESSLHKQYDLVIASCGGFPKDINFIQTHKAINNAAMFVKEKGSLIMFAQCPDGIGSDNFLEYFEFQGFSEAFKTLENNYRGNGGTALSMMDKTGRINIFIKTELDDKVCRQIGIKKCETDMLHNMTAGFNDVAVINNASLLIK